ncbi:hypothetical protein M3Y95_00408900 [Aphelenchoides besseyi]|nr:hypothetical protein M3Y95_00408900 [Aphelenchoides besseyi]
MSNESIDQEEMCQLAYAINRSPRFVISTSANLLLSVTAFVSICLYIRISSIRRVLGVIGQDLKFASASDLSPCAYVWSYQKCFVVNAQPVIAMWGFFGFHCALLLERFISIFDKRQSTRCWLGSTLGALMIMVPTTYIFTVHYGQFGMPEVPLCVGLFANRQVSSRVSINHDVAMVIFDLMCTVGDYLLFLYNRRQIAHYNRSVADVHSYSLDRSFALRSFQISTEFIIPFSFFHSIGFVIQSVVSILGLFTVQYRTIEEDRNVKEYTNLLRTGTISLHMFSLCVYHRLSRRNEPVAEWNERKDETDRYFDDFKRIIS